MITHKPFCFVLLVIALLVDPFRMYALAEPLPQTAWKDDPRIKRSLPELLDEIEMSYPTYVQQSNSSNLVFPSDPKPRRPISEFDRLPQQDPWIVAGVLIGFVGSILVLRFLSGGD